MSEHRKHRFEKVISRCPDCGKVLLYGCSYCSRKGDKFCPLTRTTGRHDCQIGRRSVVAFDHDLRRAARRIFDIIDESPGQVAFDLGNGEPINV